MDESNVVGKTALRANNATFHGTNYGIQAVELNVAGDLIVHQSDDHASTPDLKIACLQSLHFPGMHQKLDHEDRTPGSGDWVFKHEQYRAWHWNGGIMSITGKAGCGKSMLMEHIIDHEVQYTGMIDAATRLVLWFCFRYNGGEQCRSELGMLRSLLWQALKDNDKMLADFVQRPEYADRCRTQGFSHAGEWDVAQLQVQLCSVLTGYQKRGVRIQILLDGVDECGETMARRIFESLRILSTRSSGTLSVCFTARPNLVSEKDSDFRLDLEHDTCQDIHLYMDAAFDKAVIIMKPDELKTFNDVLPHEELKRLKKRLCAKTAHCFKWLAWICPRVVELAVDGESLEYIVQQMQGLPDELGAVYEEQLAKILPQDIPNALRLLELLSLDSHGHILVDDMRYAICIEENKSYCSIQNVVRGSVHWCAKPDLFAKRVSRWSGKSAKNTFHEGSENMILFTKIYGSVEPHFLEFDHHSVQEFMLQLGLRLLRTRLPHQPQEVSLADARSSFARKCLAYLMCIEVVAFGRDRTRLPKDIGCLWKLYDGNKNDLRAFPSAPPFVLTATREWPYQVRAAAAHSTHLSKMLELFHGFDSTMLSHLLTLQEIEKWGICEFEHTNSTLLHVVSACGLHGLLRHIFEPNEFSASEANKRHQSVRELCHQQLNNRDAGGRTALSLAAEHGHLDIAELLIEKGARPELPALNGWTALHYAAAHGHSEFVETLLECAVVDVDCKDSGGYTPLAVAIRMSRHKDRLVTVKLLVERSKLGVHCVDVVSNDVAWDTPHNTRSGTDVKLLDLGIDFVLNTPLLQASLSGSVEILALLLQLSKNIDRTLRTADGETILHVLLHTNMLKRHGRCDVEKMRLLIQSGRLELDAKSVYGCSPLHLACNHGEVETARLLIMSGGVDVYHRNTFGFDPLAIAIIHGDPEVVQLWIDAKLDLNRKSSGQGPPGMASGQTPLAIASWLGHNDLVQLLLSTGKVDVYTQDDCGKTPLSLAIGERDIWIVKLLIDAMIKDQSTAPSVSTASTTYSNFPVRGGHVEICSPGYRWSRYLPDAVMQGDARVVELLLRAGFFAPLTPCLMLAIDGGHFKMVCLLIGVLSHSASHRWTLSFLLWSCGDTGEFCADMQGYWTSCPFELAGDHVNNPALCESWEKVLERRAVQRIVLRYITAVLAVGFSNGPLQAT
ncbi:hypothetical protein LTR17_005002 [Elasticomyces elasticus]|nr:hypothetical protein LTR17_005002 [Elasticomyces elasticus]